MTKLFRFGTARIAQFALYSAIFLALLPYGSKLLLPKLFMSITVALALIIALARPIKKQSVARIAREAWCLLSLLVLFILLQSIEIEANPFAHSIWETAGGLTGFSVGSISVEPSLTRYGLFSLIPPFFMFIAVLHAFQGDDEAWLMIRYLAGLAVIFCLYGLLQSQFFPDHVLIKELKSPNHKFTSVLINRNHAGTLLGVSGLLMLALVINRARGVALLKLPERIVLPSNLKSEKRRGIIVWILGLFLTLICLFLTQSRGAFGATIIAWAAILPALLSHALMPSVKAVKDFRISNRQTKQWTLFLLLIFLAGLGFISLYAEGTLFRLADIDTESGRFCSYPYMFDIFWENWIFGTGFATFEAIYSLYRPAKCGVYGVWTEAHNFWLEGLIGFGILFVPVALYTLWKFFDIFRLGIKTRRSKRFASYIGLAILILISLHSLVEFSLQIPGVAIYVSAVMAALTSLSLQHVRLSRSKSAKKQS